MTNSLNMEGDDWQSVFDTLEHAFGLAATDWPSEGVQTVGELEDFLWSHMTKGSDAGEGACMTTMAFLRLRATIDLPGRLGPSASLTSLAGSNPRLFRRRLAAASGLALPSFHMSGRATALFILLFLGLPIGLVAHDITREPSALAMALLSWPLMILVVWTDRNRVPTDLTTLGDLARGAVPLNYRQLAEKGGAVRRDGLRDALRAIIADVVQVENEIDRDTRLFATVH